MKHQLLREKWQGQPPIKQSSIQSGRKNFHLSPLLQMTNTGGMFSIESKYRLLFVYYSIRFRCNFCDKKVKCSHIGKQDLVKHCKSKSHIAQVKALESQPKLAFSQQQSSETMKRTEAELQMAVLAASKNFPLVFHDHLSQKLGRSFLIQRLHQNTTLLVQRPPA